MNSLYEELNKLIVDLLYNDRYRKIMRLLNSIDYIISFSSVTYYFNNNKCYTLCISNQHNNLIALKKIFPNVQMVEKILYGII